MPNYIFHIIFIKNIFILKIKGSLINSLTIFFILLILIFDHVMIDTFSKISVEGGQIDLTNCVYEIIIIQNKKCIEIKFSSNFYYYFF